MTILIRLIVYISYIDSIICPLNPLPASLKAIARGFFVLVHVGYMKFINHIPSPQSPSLTLPPLTSSPLPHCTYFIVLY
jgi:hypothetical protein